MAQRILILVLFVLAVVTSSALTVLYLQNKGGSSTVSGGNLQQEIAKYIEENPEVIIQGLKKAQARQADQDAQKSVGAVKDVLPKLQKMKAMSGDDKAPVTFAIFHDYNCGFCRKSVGDVIKVSENFKNVRVVLVDLPILGPLSVDKGKVSIAISRIAPEKSFEFFKIMEKETPQNVDQVIAIAEKVGVDLAQLKEEIKSPEIENILSENRAIAEQVGVQGTPAFIINDQIIKGALGYEAFAAAINKAAGK